MLPGVTPLGDYLAELKRNLDKGIATEHTYRPALERCMAEFTAARLGRRSVFRTAGEATMLGSAAAALLNA